MATAEIRFGDNDRLAARVAEMMQADQLVLLSDIDGLYTADPRHDPRAPRTSRSSPPSRPRSRRWAASRRPATRPAACAPSWPRRGSPPRRAARWRSPIGHADRPLRALEQGARCTWFLAAPEGRSRTQALDRRRAGPARHIGGGRRRGARSRRRPVAAAGGRARVEGAFERGDPVVVRAPDGRRWRAACRPTPVPMPNGSPVIDPTRSRRSSAGVAATRSSTATIWCCCDRWAPARLDLQRQDDIEERRRCISKPKPPSICNVPPPPRARPRMYWRGHRMPNATRHCVRWRQRCDRTRPTFWPPTPPTSPPARGPPRSATGWP